MKISVFASDANPAIDKRLLRRSAIYCEREVASGRAKLITGDIRDGIQLLPSCPTGAKTEARGSKEQSGCLTAYESSLSAEYRGDTRNLGKLSMQYEYALDKHVRDGRKGMPRQCGVIAARVKTILSTPTIRFA